MVDRCQRGFTLIELLLALTLLGMIMALAYGGLRSMTRSTDSADALMQQQTHLRATQGFVHRQLARALPLAYFADEDERIQFEGDRDWVQFVAPMPGYLGAGGPQVQRIELERDAGGGYALVFTHVPLLAYEDENSLRDARPFVLLRNIDDGEFRFQGQDERGRLTDWQNDWETPAALPVAVNLALQMGETARVSWPELYTALRVDSTSGRLQQTNQRGAELRRVLVGDRNDVR
jgi:general secretion pathway protein J